MNCLASIKDYQRDKVSNLTQNIIAPAIVVLRIFLDNCQFITKSEPNNLFWCTEFL